ncbi:hypothetical protein SAMN05444004_10664 [Jannaschia faecimaris]|uniref:Uncharacterized protein n=1 Tax=Jannaschia faecimaris TaxID=1244108 RepID=A0A1H3QBK9_9RHOB|nr:hypothetical protein [Jannaschia faecimaris]SDZ10796.1 hypothetical protein SAMN05444004_10664 [Jannaschia faecimaris]
MTYAGWIVVCLLGIFLAFVVAALHRANNKVRRMYADKVIMSGD